MSMLLYILPALVVASAIGAEAVSLDAASLHQLCSDQAGQHGFYTIVPANDGFAFNGTAADGEQGVSIGPNTLGGGCRAKVFQACNVSFEGGMADSIVSSSNTCETVVPCNATQDQECFNCVKAKFQRKFAARVKAFADCDDEETPISDASPEQQQEVLDAIKDVAINECSVKACRYVTEARSSVRFKGDELFFLARRQKHVKPMRKCPALRTIHNTSTGCRWSLRRISAKPCFESGFSYPCSANALKLTFLLEGVSSNIIGVTEIFKCHTRLAVPSYLQQFTDYSFGGHTSVGSGTYHLHVLVEAQSVFFFPRVLLGLSGLNCPASAPSSAAGSGFGPLSAPIALIGLEEVNQV
eukprot:m.34477 g.34477  ORF g.34477 m.34477 type:complete len:355 (+) comp12309_c0_seq1:86-1150(+)